MSQLSSQSFTSSIDSSLLVRDVAGSYRPAEPAEVLQAALRVLEGQLRGTEMLSSPQAVRDFLRIKLGTLEHEVFAVIHLDAQHRVIEYVEMFRGTVTQPTVAHYTNNYTAEQSPSRALEATRALMLKRRRWHGTRASCRLEAPTCRLVARRPLAALSTPHGFKYKKPNTERH